MKTLFLPTVMNADFQRALKLSRKAIMSAKRRYDPENCIGDLTCARYAGRLTNYLSGISGVAAGGQAIINLPLNQRVHAIDLQCTGVNFTGGVAIVPTIVTAGGFSNTTGTCKLNVTNGVVTSVTYAAGNSAGASATTVLSVPDPTGYGPIILTCTAAGTGALGNATFTISGNNPGPIDPRTLITSVRISVNGQNLRDISPSLIMGMQAACGYNPDFGTLSLFFTEPGLNFLRDNELTSWDLFGQTSFSIQLGISATVTTPGINGSITFDGNRNTRKASANDVSNGLQIANAQGKMLPVKVGQRVPFLQPVTQHSITQQIVVGKNDITTIPWNFPLRRLWFLGATPGNLYALELLVDGNKIMEATAQQIYSLYAKYGFQIGNVYVANTNGGGYGSGASVLNSVAGAPAGGNLTPTTIPNGALLGATAGNQGSVGQNGVFPFDLAWIGDFDGRPWEALTVQQSLIVRVYSAAAQALTIVYESMPGGYIS